MTLQRVPINNFRGGLNTRDSPFELQPNESPDLQDVTISALVGQLESRKGKVRLDISGMPPESPDYMKQVTLGNSASVLMLSINGGVWFCNAAGEVKKLFAGTPGTVWSFEVFADAAFKDWVYMGNGVDPNQKWDGVAAATVVWPGGLLPVSILKVWENRMIISGYAGEPQRIFFSEFGDPEATIKVYGFVDVRGSEEDLDAIQDLAVLGSRLFVMKRRSVFFVSSAVTFLNRRVGGPGVYGRFQTVELEDKLYFFNPQGIFSTGGVQITMESGSINNFFPERVTKTAYSRVRIMATKDTYPRLLLSVPVDGATVNNRIIEMIPHINFRRIGGRRYLLLPAFMLHTLTASALAAWNPTGHEETIVGGSSSGNTLDSIPVNDTFQRAEENPLSNGGKWSIMDKAGTIGGKIGKKIGALVEALCVSTPNENFSGYWNVGEIKNPIVRVDVVGPILSPTTSVKQAGGFVQLWACNDASLIRNGYNFEVSYRAHADGTTFCLISLSRVVAGAGTQNLLPATTISPGIGPGDRLALRVLNGIVSGWVKRAGNTLYEQLFAIADATYNKGYSGLFFNPTAGPVNENTDVTSNCTFHNFATAEATGVGRLSTLFKGTDDEGVAIQGYWHSAWMAIQGEEPKERLRRLNVELQGDVIVDVYKDFQKEPAFSTTVPKAVEGEETAYRFSRVRPETRGRFHSIRFRSDPTGEPFLINSAELVVRGGKEH